MLSNEKNCRKTAFKNMHSYKRVANESWPAKLLELQKYPQL